MRYFLAFIACLYVNMSLAAISVVWENATPGPGQTISGTEILVDGSLVGLTDQQTLEIDDSGWFPGDYSITARHIGTVDGQSATGEESSPLIYTVADSGVPGVAPELRFPELDRTSGAS